MKIAVLTSTSFSLDGNAYVRGDYAPEYRGQSVRIKHVTTSAYINQQYKHWSSFTDSNDAAYADFATFTAALAIILGEAAADATISSSTGTATQITSKTTGVTASYKSGVVTTVALTDSADTGFEFIITNTYATAASVILVSPIYAGTQGVVNVRVKSTTAGSFTVVVTNTGTQALNAAAKVAFAIVA